MARILSNLCPFCGYNEVRISSNLNWWNVECLGEIHIQNGCRASLSGSHEFKTGYGENHVKFVDADKDERRWPRWDSEACEKEALSRWNKRI